MSGAGQRFIDAGYSVPKPLIVVDGKTIIEHVVNLFPGEADVTFICRNEHLGTQSFKMGSILKRVCPTAKIHGIDGHKFGPVYAVAQTFQHINDNDEVIVSYCDYGTGWDYKGFLEDTRSRNADGAIPCYKGFHPHMLGSDNYAFLKETEPDSRWLEKIQEKQPFTDNRMNEYASNGTYYFRTGAILKQSFQELMNKDIQVRGEYYVSMVYNLMRNNKQTVSIFEIQHMLQWGTPSDLEEYKLWSKYFKKYNRGWPFDGDWNDPFGNRCTHKYWNTIYDEMNVLTVLPLAGFGSRFSKEGYTTPKPFLQVDDTPMVMQALDCLPFTPNTMLVCLQDHYDQLLTTVQEAELDNDDGRGKMDVCIHSIPDVTQGQACTTRLGIDKFKETHMGHDVDNNPLVITACDNGAMYDIEEYVQLVRNPDVDVIVWSFRNHVTSRRNPNMYAWLEIDDAGYIQHVSCKKFIPDKHGTPTTGHAIIGTMFFRKAKYFTDGLHRNQEENIRTNGEFYVDDVINQCIRQGLKVSVFEVDHYICWGTPNDYKTYNYWFRYFSASQSFK